jgi:hypothetical protein
MVQVEYSVAPGKMNHEKNLKSKISCQTPFKQEVQSFFSLPIYSTIGRQQSELSTESPKPTD